MLIVKLGIWINNMKKILGIMSLSILLSNSVLADVYYCIDKVVAGLKYENGNYIKANYGAKKFKAKIDFEKKILSSKDLYSRDLYCTKLITQKFSMTCSSMLGETFTIEGDKPSMELFNYARAETYGRTDSLVVAYGNCEKF